MFESNNLARLKNMVGLSGVGMALSAVAGYLTSGKTSDLNLDMGEFLQYLGLGSIIIGNFGAYGVLSTALSSLGAASFIAGPMIKAFMLSPLVNISMGFAKSIGESFATGENKVSELKFDFEFLQDKFSGYVTKYLGVSAVTSMARDSALAAMLGKNWIYVQELGYDALFGGVNFATSEFLGANSTMGRFDNPHEANTHQFIFGWVDSILYNSAGLVCNDACFVAAASVIEHLETCYKDVKFNTGNKCLALRVLDYMDIKTGLISDEHQYEAAQ